MKDTNGKIFGGYTNLIISGDAYWEYGEGKSFVFSFIEEDVIKCKKKIGEKEIFTGSCNEPIVFGHKYNFDFYVYNNSNLNKTSCSLIGNSFESNS